MTEGISACPRMVFPRPGQFRVSVGRLIPRVGGVCQQRKPGEHRSGRYLGQAGREDVRRARAPGTPAQPENGEGDRQRASTPVDNMGYMPCLGFCNGFP